MFERRCPDAIGSRHARGVLDDVGEAQKEEDRNGYAQRPQQDFAHVSLLDLR